MQKMMVIYRGQDIKSPACRLAGSYSVEEALPVAYLKTWENAVITPGVCLLTLFRRRPGLSHAAFLDYKTIETYLVRR